MTVAGVVMGAIAAMRCACCGAIMGQGERERNPRTKEGQPVHARCCKETCDNCKEAVHDPYDHVNTYGPSFTCKRKP